MDDYPQSFGFDAGDIGREREDSGAGASASAAAATTYVAESDDVALMTVERDQFAAAVLGGATTAALRDFFGDDDDDDDDATATVRLPGRTEGESTRDDDGRPSAAADRIRVGSNPRRRRRTATRTSAPLSPRS